MLEIVVSHYEENLDWLLGHEHQTTLYNKGESRHIFTTHRLIQLPNVGRESHTYLYHIVHNYDSLASLTLFTQGRIEDSVEHFQGLDNLIEKAETSSDDLTIFRSKVKFKDWNGIRHVKKWAREREDGSMRLADLTPGEFWKWMFDGMEHPESVEWVWAATFAATRKAIYRHPLLFYRKLLNYIEQTEHANPEEGHDFERFWISILQGT